MASPAILSCLVLLIAVTTAAAGAALAPKPAKPPKKVRCKDKAFKDCYGKSGLSCPATCPHTCVADCSICQAVCTPPPPPPPKPTKATRCKDKKSKCYNKSMYCPYTCHKGCKVECKTCLPTCSFSPPPPRPEPPTGSPSAAPIPAPEVESLLLVGQMDELGILTAMV